MRITDWSSDVCSSDRYHHPVQPGHGVGQRHRSPTGLPELGKLAGAAEFAKATAQVEGDDLMPPRQPGLPAPHCLARQAGQGRAEAPRQPPQHRKHRKSDAEGTSWSVRVGLGMRHLIKKKKTIT